MHCPFCGMLHIKDSFPSVYHCGTKSGTNEQSEACKKICYEYADFDRMEQCKNDEIAELERNNKELESLVLKAFELGYDLKIEELEAELKGREIYQSAYRTKFEQLKVRVNLLCM